MFWKRHANLLALVIAGAAAFMALAGCGHDNTSSPVTEDPVMGEDPAPPTPPAGLTLAKATSDGLLITWEASPDVDVVGYHVYLYDPDPNRDNSYVQLTAEPISPTHFAYRSPVAQETYYFKVSAVDGDGLTSQGSKPIEVTWGGGPYDGSEQGGGEPDVPPPGETHGPDDGQAQHPDPGTQIPGTAPGH